MKMKEITTDTKLYLVYRGSGILEKKDEWHTYQAKISKLTKSSIWVQ